VISRFGLLPNKPLHLAAAVIGNAGSLAPHEVVVGSRAAAAERPSVGRRQMNAYAAPLVLIVAGALLVISAARLPAYTDPTWQDRFVTFTVSPENSDQLTARWYAAKAEVETPRNSRLDLGMGLVALGLTIALLFVVGQVRSLQDLSSLRSPATRRRFFVLAGLTWLSFVPAEWFWLYYTMARGDYPWWADSIAIPAFGALVVGIVGLGVVLLGVALALRGAALPVRLWSPPASGPPYFVCIGLIATAILALLVLLAGIAAAPFLVPSALFTLYLILSGRAAAAVGRRPTSRCT